MKKRKKDEIIAFKHAGKPNLKEVNPKIIQVFINLDFSKNVEYSHDSYKMTLRPYDKITCTPDCINHSCTEGYFDLTNEIYKLLKDQLKIITGELVCEGWQDTERVCNHRCMAKVAFQITAEYEE